MKIVIAPDSFKESLTALEVSQAIKTGLARVWPDAEYVSVPIADGGEGTVQALIDATGGKKVYTEVRDPRGNPIQACYGVLGDSTTAVIEVAEACGLHRIPLDQRDTKYTSSYGVGQLILNALDLGVNRLIIGLGGTATTDAGSGMLAALGGKFLDIEGEQITPCGEALLKVHQIDVSKLDSRLSQCEILVACDVDNPLCGDMGAAAFFGPQKGATSEDIAILDRALLQFGKVTEKTSVRPVINAKGAGAAGGMGAAWLGYTHAQLKPGVELVLQIVELEDQLLDADLVITGEGKIDKQTIHGKAPVGVAKLAKKHDIPVIAVAGCTNDGYQSVYDSGIDAVFTCVPRAMNLDDAFAEAETNLTNLAENIARMYQLY